MGVYIADQSSIFCYMDIRSKKQSCTIIDPAYVCDYIF